MELYSCAVTGHRPTRFKWKYNENNNGCKRLKKRMRDQFILLYEKGVRRFYVGGALGVDMWAGEILLQMKEQSEYCEIEVILVIPFLSYNKDWDGKSKNRLLAIRQHCTEVIVAGTDKTDPVFNYRLRNQYMIDHSDCLLAVYDSNRTFRSGTMQTVNYAKKKMLSLILIHPDTAAVIGDI